MKNTLKITTVAALIVAGVFIITAFKPLNEPVYVYRQFSTVESVIPGGIGRSRIVSTDSTGTAIEKDLLNFYSFTGINFGNIANNDRLIVDKINEYTASGWELYVVTSGVQSPAEKSTSGIFITRYLFRKIK